METNLSFTHGDFSISLHVGFLGDEQGLRINKVLRPCDYFDASIDRSVVATKVVLARIVLKNLTRA